MPRRTKFVDYDARRDPRTPHFCCACQQDLDPAKSVRRVYLTSEMHAVHPDDVNPASSQPDDYGWQPIGRDCAKRLGIEWTMPLPAASVAAVKRLTNNGRISGWIGFKRNLGKLLGVTESSITRWNVPQEWIDAYKRTFRR